MDKWDQLCNVSGKRTPGCKSVSRYPRQVETLAFESGKEDKWGGAQWVTGVPLRETRLQGAGARP